MLSIVPEKGTQLVYIDVNITQRYSKMLTHTTLAYANPCGFAYFGARVFGYSDSTYPCTLYIYFCLSYGEIINTNHNLYEHYNA